MSTITLTASADYGHTGQFVARIKGRDSKYTFEREFIGRKIGKRGETTQATVDEPGLYELRDSTRKGKKDRYVLVLPDANNELKSMSCDLDDAMMIAKRLDSGEHINQIARWYVNYWELITPADKNDERSDKNDERSKAIATIRELMVKHNITAAEL